MWAHHLWVLPLPSSLWLKCDSDNHVISNRWNAARCFASFLDRTRLCQGRTVLELGAGGALPSIIAILTSATKVVVTDYPDTPLLDNIHFNISNNVPPALQSVFSVQGYIWGRDTQVLQNVLPSGSIGFGVIILSDLIFNHSEHDALLNTCEQAISIDDPEACVLVFYSHHRPRVAHRDMEFFEKARGRGWQTDEIVTETFPVGCFISVISGVYRVPVAELCA